MDLAVCALIQHPNDPSLILGVSRKDNPNNFGLPGGKVDPGETLQQAVIREIKEETGLDLIDPQMVAEFPCYGEVNYLTSTWVGKVSGDFDTQESGRVAWVTWQKLFEGSFKDYNKKLYTILNMHKMLDAY